MKHKLLIVIAFVMAITQGWALPMDSSSSCRDGRDLSTRDDRELVLTKDSLNFSKLIRIDPSFTVNPSSLDFDTVMVGESATRTFKVRGLALRGNLHLEVLTSRSSTSDGFTINRTTITPAQAMRGVNVTVTFTPEAAGDYNSTCVRISGGGAEPQTVALSATAVDFDFPFINPDLLKPYITANPQSVDFGTIELGKQERKRIKVTGLLVTGPLTLEVLTSRYNSSDGFTISHTSITKNDARLGAYVTVTFKPQRVGTFNTTYIKISGGGAESITVPLSGTCVEPQSSGAIEEDDADNDVTDTWEAAVSGLNELSQNVKILAEGQDIIIESAMSQEAIISDIAGHAHRVNLQAGRNVIPANSSGIHIVRVGNQTAKLMLR